eukprot:bmy_06859T0
MGLMMILPKIPRYDTTPSLFSYRNTADTEDAYQPGELRLFVSTQPTCHPVPPEQDGQTGLGPAPPVESPRLLQEELPLVLTDGLQLASGQLHWFLALFSLANQSSPVQKTKPTFGIKAGETPWTAPYVQRHPRSEDQEIQQKPAVLTKPKFCKYLYGSMLPKSKAFSAQKKITVVALITKMKSFKFLTTDFQFEAKRGLSCLRLSDNFHGKYRPDLIKLKTQQV